MAKDARAVAMAAVGMLVAHGVSAAADETVPTDETTVSVGHVRSSSPTLGALIQQATYRSATFGRLVETIDASDSYVYVTEGECRRGIRACLVSVAMAGGRRMMRGKIDTFKAEWDLMGSIGHELRHAIEVIGDSSVTDNASMFLFYEPIGVHGIGGQHETQVAIGAGNTIRSEVRRFNRREKSK